MKILKYFLQSIAAAMVFYILSALVYDTPQQRDLRRENALLSSEIERMGERMDLVEDVTAGLHARDTQLYHSIFASYPPEVEAAPDFHRRSTRELNRMAASSVARMDSIAALVSVALDSLTLKAGKAGALAGIPSVLPVRNFSLNCTGASVGPKYSPFFKTIREHQGIDLMAAEGTEVIATASGVVADVGRQARDFGNIVILRHPGGYHTVYAHLDAIKVSRGQSVARGKVIGTVGTSGRTFVPHLHYEVVKDSLCMEPVHYFFGDLNEIDYNEMLTRALTTGQSMD